MCFLTDGIMRVRELPMSRGLAKAPPSAFSRNLHPIAVIGRALLHETVLFAVRHKRGHERRTSGAGANFWGGLLSMHALNALRTPSVRKGESHAVYAIQNGDWMARENSALAIPYRNA